MQFQLSKRKVISEIKQYFFEHDLPHKQRASAILVKIDPKFRGLLINSATIEKLGIELDDFMNTLSVEFSAFLVDTAKQHNIKLQSISAVARRKLKAHQQYIMRNLLLEIKQKNETMANHLRGKLDLFPELLLPGIKENNDRIFSFSSTTQSGWQAFISNIAMCVRRFIAI